MKEVMENFWATLDHLITEAEERRVEQMLHIATVLAEDKDATEAEEGLRQIENLLMRMRAHRAAKPSQRSEVFAAN